MQLKIYHTLNLILTLLVASIIGLAVLIGLNFEALGDNKMIVILIFMAYTVIAFYGYKMFEQNYDKRMIQKMVINNQVAIANITNAEPLNLIRDTSLKIYCLWNFDVEYYDQNMKKHTYTVTEKLNPTVKEVPNGTVYITHNPDKLERKFIVQNVMIGHVPTLQPIVAKYEKNKQIPIKYLNVYYKDGLVIETFQQSLRQQKENEKVSRS